MFYFNLYLGKIPILTNIFQLGGSTTNQFFFRQKTVFLLHKNRCLLTWLRQTILGLATTSGTQLMPGEFRGVASIKRYSWTVDASEIRRKRTS